MAEDNRHRRALRSTIALTVVVLTVFPAVAVLLSRSWRSGWALSGRPAHLPAPAGLALLGVGLSLVATTIRLFTAVGQGSLAPWDPPKILVVAGPYPQLRKPLHSGIFRAVCGESLLAGWAPPLLFITAALAFHWLHIPLMEGRRLTDKFGQDYLKYKQHVPAWFSHLTSWRRGQK